MNKYQDQSGQRGGSGGPGPGGSGPPKNPLAAFKTAINSAAFGSDAVMTLAEDLGESLARPQNRGRGEREGKDNTRNQVRKFYNLVREAKTSANAELPDATEASTARQLEKTKIKLRSLQAQVAYAVARNTISADFKEFFDASVKRLLESTDLPGAIKDFAVFFESLYAYFYFYTDPSRRQH